MADKSIDQLNEAEKIYATDLFVLQQSGAAKKLTGQVLLNWLTAAADGHGGIKSISKLDTSGLVDTYRITLADTTTFDFAVNNGKGITGISKTSTSGLTDTYTIKYNDNTSSTFTVKNGEKGDKGDNTYTWIKYASQEPTEESHNMGDVPDDWRGEYNGPLAEAPTDWKQYKWYKIKGEQGNTGEKATLVNWEVVYQVSDSGTIIPSGDWSDSVPVVAQGKYLWTRTTSQFNTGDPIVAYSVARMGKDGAGSVSSVCNKSPGSDGNVKLAAADVGALPSSGGDMTGAVNMNGQKITGLNDPTESTEAARKAYVDTKASRVGVSSSALATMAVGDTHKLSRSIIGKDPIFAILSYAFALGRIGGASGNRNITFSNVTSATNGANINIAVFSLTDDGRTLQLTSSKQVAITSSGITVKENQSLYFGSVTIISA